MGFNSDWAKFAAFLTGTLGVCYIATKAIDNHYTFSGGYKDAKASFSPNSDKETGTEKDKK